MEGSSENQVKNTILSWPLEGKKILWFSKFNQYLIAASPADQIIERISQGDNSASVQAFCQSDLQMDQDQAKTFEIEIKQFIKNCIEIEPKISGKKVSLNKNQRAKQKSLYEKFYQIFGIIFFVEYESEKIEDLIHPKFAHLEIQAQQKYSHHFKVMNSDLEYSLWVNDVFIGSWEAHESHFMTGKFSMEILQKIYQRPENQWMGVFHAAGITDGDNCIIFLGDSGNGKSTLSSILMAHGLDVLADDFLPVDGESQDVCLFPAAISVKKQGYDFLIPKFPELKEAKEYFSTTQDKTFRYLAPNETKAIQVPCKAFVFVKYKENSGFQFQPLRKEDAFKKLLPDSWISKEQENARRFVEWFLSMPSFEMTYSDNNLMVKEVKKMLKNEF